ncbi:hypothetical protein A1OS_13685 [Enterovibrio norvegicus]|uniref:Uncharacterized protein n=1 Tax=Enterovibrio norvegicus DSM 15893 TaxID=1121869 RepID=A0A1I5Y2K4_9GAMM|nr:hypothetical protein A1OS_13685 [Enterovibrio norvegicus]SFQ38396.1 hypothetical protein SAMN03084138_04922 [Enterovibrio norvegicus DSM 15893]
MDRIIKEELWSHVCFERDDEIYLTYLVQSGPATVDYTVKLNTSEVNLVQSGDSEVKRLLGGFEQSRFIIPPIWPTK